MNSCCWLLITAAEHVSKHAWMQLNCVWILQHNWRYNTVGMLFSMCLDSRCLKTHKHMQIGALVFFKVFTGAAQVLQKRNPANYQTVKRQQNNNLVDGGNHSSWVTWLPLCDMLRLAVWLHTFPGICNVPSNTVRVTECSALLGQLIYSCLPSKPWHITPMLLKHERGWQGEPCTVQLLFTV